MTDFSFRFENDGFSPEASPATNTNIAYGGTVNTGDLLAVGLVLNNADVITPPAGWLTVSGGNPMLSDGFWFNVVFYKIAGASEPATPNFAWTNSTFYAWFALTYATSGQGVAADAGWAANNNASTSVNTTPGVTAVAARALLINVYSCRNPASTAQNYIGFSAGQTQRVAQSISTGSRFYALGVADAQLTTAGATGSFTATQQTSTDNTSSGQSFTLVPTAAGTTTPWVPGSLDDPPISYRNVAYCSREPVPFRPRRDFSGWRSERGIIRRPSLILPASLRAKRAA